MGPVLAKHDVTEFLGEGERMRVRPGLGADLVQGLKTLEAVCPLIRHDHERCDGSDYPTGACGPWMSSSEAEEGP